MRTMGWTLVDYMAAPHSVVEEIWLFMQTENRAKSELMQRANGSE